MNLMNELTVLVPPRFVPLIRRPRLPEWEAGSRVSSSKAPRLAGAETALSHTFEAV
jgi:hypothetical protein